MVRGARYFLDEVDATESVGDSELLDYQNNNMENAKVYSFWKGLGKGVVSLILFAVPILISSNPAWLNLTVGGVLVILVNFLKVKYTNL